MNTAALKSFAPAVRRQLMEAVTQKLDFVLSARTPDYLTTFARQVGELRKLAQADRPGLIERVAYTWFNRFAALRYLDAKGWHPFRARVLTAASIEETQPEILKLVRAGSLPEDLRPHVKAGTARLNDLLDGRIPSADPQGEVYRHLVLAACHFYHVLLPDLFERLDDETELLLPDDLLTAQSVAKGFRTEITDSDCAEVEVLGWLYQFYISEKKDAVMGRKTAVPTQDIPAVTQLFTPHWIVRYLVENSLGRLWVLNRPGSQLRERMPYYVEADSEADFLRIGKPEEIRVLDPAVGSGHMLTYAFDLLFAIYEEEGYAPSDIPGLILTHNLFGADICPRAVQIAAFALVCKARDKSRRFFQTGALVHPRVLALQNVSFREDELAQYVVKVLDLRSLFDAQVLELLHQFEYATTFGSLIEPCLQERQISVLCDALDNKDFGDDLFLQNTHGKVIMVLEQALLLSQRYHVALANPPYMGSVSFTPQLKVFVKTLTEEGRTDLFALFISRLGQLALTGGYVSMVTMQSWLFLASYESLRRKVLTQWSFSSLAHFGPRAFDSLGGEVVQVAAFVLGTRHRAGVKSLFFRVLDGHNEADKQSLLLCAIADPHSALRFLQSAEQMLQVPGAPIAYWLSEKITKCFANGKPLGEALTFKQGAATSDNGRFLRLWHEVSQEQVDYSCKGPSDLSSSVRKWFPYNKGGSFRKWYGNNDYFVNWERDGEEMKAFTATLPQGTWVRLKSRDYYCLPCITYSALSGSAFGGRISDAGFLFDTKGSCIFGPADELSKYVGLLNSKPAKAFLDVLCPTLDYSMVGIKQIPVPLGGDVKVTAVVDECCRIARADWDNAETSWNFRDLPLLRTLKKETALAEAWKTWREQCIAAVHRMKELETENNRLFIAAYGLQDELTPDVVEDQVTLTSAEARKDMASFLSYAVGCMMGRYSLDKAGIVLANAGDTLEDYLNSVRIPRDQLLFLPSAEGIIPVLDGEWFEDDIVFRTREFLRVTFGEVSLRENIRFIEDSLGKDLRRYFLTDFYKDHLQTYKKRPIYWLVQSPRKGFSVLIYLHRYTRDTMNLVLNRYLREYQVKLRNRSDHLARLLASDGSTTREKTEARREADKVSKTLHECEEWERQTVLPLAQERIDLDLDDGVKVNYLKLGEALAPVAGMESKGEE